VIITAGTIALISIGILHLSTAEKFWL